MVTWSGDAGWYPVDVWSNRAWLRGNPAASIDKCRLEAPTSASRLPGSDVCFPVEALWFNFFCGEGCGTYGVFGLGGTGMALLGKNFGFFFFFSLPRREREGKPAVCKAYSSPPIYRDAEGCIYMLPGKTFSSPLHAAVDGQMIGRENVLFVFSPPLNTKHNVQKYLGCETVHSPSLHYYLPSIFFSFSSSAGCRRCPRDRCRRRGYVCPRGAGCYGARAGG